MHIKGFIVLIGGAQAAIITGLKKKSEQHRVKECSDELQAETKPGVGVGGGVKVV